jgi:hypothetical protein
LNKRATRKDRYTERQRWYKEGLIKGLAKSNMKKYPKWLHEELQEEHFLRKDRHSV